MKGRPKKKYPEQIAGDEIIRRYFEDLHHFPPLPSEKLETYIPGEMLLLTGKGSYKPGEEEWFRIDL